MKRLLCAVSMFALLVPAAAIAQQQGDRHHGSQHAQRPGNGGGQGHARPPAQRPTTPNRPNRPGRPGAGERPTIQPVPNRPGRPGAGERPTIQPVPNRPHIRPIRGPAYRYPRGYAYRRWSVGLILPSIFLSNYYFYNDWRMVGAYPPPPGYVWVRYGPDLLLVSRHSGRIRDVLYGVFY